MLASVTAFLSAGLTKLVGWDIPAYALFLLIGFGVVAFAFSRIPRDSLTWQAEPGSSLAKLKQTIGTTRAVLTFVMVLFIGMLLATSKTLTDQLPDQIASAVEQVVASPPKDAILLTLAEPIKNAKGVKIYFASAEEASAGAGSPAATAQPSGAFPLPPKIYVVAAPSLLRDMVDGKIVPTFFTVASTVLAFCAIFTAVVYLMEILGGVQLEIARKGSRHR